MNRYGKAVLAVVICSLPRLAAQTSAQGSNTPRFEVASIKLVDLANGVRLQPSNDPSRVSYDRRSLQELIVTAYDIKTDQIVGAPAWLDTDVFDIAATLPAASSPADVNLMLQNLLSERFGLSIHREQRLIDIYGLKVAKKGLKMKATPPTVAVIPAAPTVASGNGGMELRAAPDGCPDLPAPANGKPRLSSLWGPEKVCVVAFGTTCHSFAIFLRQYMDRPVLDATGVTTKFDFRLYFDPSTLARTMGGRPAANNASEVAIPTVNKAIEEQLGLMLEKGKSHMNILVIDHVNRSATEN